MGALRRQTSLFVIGTPWSWRIHLCISVQKRFDCAALDSYFVQLCCFVVSCYSVRPRSLPKLIPNQKGYQQGVGICLVFLLVLLPEWIAFLRQDTMVFMLQ